MFSFSMYPTNEYERLLNYFYNNDLDLKCNNLTYFIKGYKLTQGEDVIVGGALLSNYEGTYLLTGIAVDKILRKFGLGKILLKKVINEVKSRDGHLLYLITNEPEFFLKENFSIINDASEAKHIYEINDVICALKDSNNLVMKIEF